MPPRSLKTQISTGWLPKWIMENIPYKTIGIFSCSADIVAANIESRIPDLIPKICNLNLHTYTATDICIIDDYCKSDTENNSIKYNDLVFHNFVNIITHLMTNAFVLIMASRWDKNDLVGRIITQVGKQETSFPFLTDYINLTSLATVNDIFGRDIDTSFWPEKYPTEKLHDIKNLFGSKWFEIMYQGRPA